MKKNFFKFSLFPIGFGGMLALIFTVAKLGGYIDWSWWLVLLPAYWGIAFLFGIFLIGVTVALICGIIMALICILEWYDNYRRHKRWNKKTLQQRYEALQRK